MPYLREAEQYYYHFPNVGNMMQLQDHLRVFREAYRGIRCNVHEDHIIYTVYWGGAETRAKAANELISKLNLPLVAAPSTHKGLANDTFIIKLIDYKMTLTELYDTEMCTTQEKRLLFTYLLAMKLFPIAEIVHLSMDKKWK